MDIATVRDVLEDVVTIVCGDSPIVRPFLKRPSQRIWRSASPVNKSNATFVRSTLNRKTVNVSSTPTPTSSTVVSKQNSTGNSSSGMLSDSLVSDSKYRSRTRTDANDSRTSISDESRSTRKRRRSRSPRRSRSRSQSYDDIYACNVCNDEFRRPQILCLHLYRNHQLPSCCAYCNKHFFDTSQLMTHIKTAHVGRTSFDCWFCSCKPAGMRIFWDHMWHYHKKNMFRCKCGQICFSLHCFQAHQALCCKLKMKSFHDVRWSSTDSSINNAKSPYIKNEFIKRRNEFFRPLPAKSFNNCPPNKRPRTGESPDREPRNDIHQNGDKFNRRDEFNRNDGEFRQNGDEFHHDGNEFHHDGDEFHHDGDEFRQNGNEFHQNGDEFHHDGNEFHQNVEEFNRNSDEFQQNQEIYPPLPLQCLDVWSPPNLVCYPNNPPPNYYPMQTAFGFHPMLKDPRLLKKLTAEHGAKLEDDSKNAEKQNSPEINKPIASSTPVCCGSNKAEMPTVSSDKVITDQKLQTKLNSPPKFKKSFSVDASMKPGHVWYGVRVSVDGSVADAPKALPVKPTMSVDALPVETKPKIDCDSTHSKPKPLWAADPAKPKPLWSSMSLRSDEKLPDFSETRPSSCTLGSKLLSCGCKTGSFDHVCDILKDLKQEIDDEEKTTQAKVKVDSVTVKETTRSDPKAKDDNATTKTITKKSTGTFLKNISVPESLKISTTRIAALRAKVKKVKQQSSVVDVFTSPPRNGVKGKQGVVDLTSPTKCETKEKNTTTPKSAKQDKSTTVQQQPQRAIKFLPFAKVEQIQQKLSSKTSDKAKIKVEPKEEKKNFESVKVSDNSKQKCNRKSVGEIQHAHSTSSKKVQVSKSPEPENHSNQQNSFLLVKDSKTHESFIPPKKRWASEFVQYSESQKCTEKSSERIETEFQCSLCDYRCLKKKSVEKHLVKKHCLSVNADRYCNFYNTYEVCKTVLDGEAPLANRENLALSAKFDNLRQEVDLLKQCLTLMKPEMNQR